VIRQGASGRAGGPCSARTLRRRAGVGAGSTLRPSQQTQRADRRSQLGACFDRGGEIEQGGWCLKDLAPVPSLNSAHNGWRSGEWREVLRCGRSIFLANGRRTGSPSGPLLHRAATWRADDGGDCRSLAGFRYGGGSQRAARRWNGAVPQPLPVMNGPRELGGALAAGRNLHIQPEGGPGLSPARLVSVR